MEETAIQNIGRGQGAGGAGERWHLGTEQEKKNVKNNNLHLIKVYI